MKTRGHLTTLGQGDIAVNLFAILLIVFVLMDLSERQSAVDGFPLPIVTRPDADIALGVVPGWRPVQPIRARFYIWNGKAYRLSSDAFAGYFAGGDLDFSDAPGVVNRSRRLDDDADPSSFQADLYHGDVFPASLTAYAFELTKLVGGELPVELSADLERLRAADIFVPRSDVEAAYPLVEVLSRARRPATLRVLPTAGRFAYARKSSRQGFEASFK